MNSSNADHDNTGDFIGTPIAWTEDKIALLEARLELARLKGESQTHIDGRIVLIEFGEDFVKSLRLEMRERKHLKAKKIPGHK